MTIEKDNLLPWLEEHMGTITNEIGALEASGRGDEANLRKAARNIYGIFAQLAAKGRDAQALRAQADVLRAAWQSAQGVATTHNDHAQAAIEGVKLEALRAIEARLATAQEGNQ